MSFAPKQAHKELHPKLNKITSEIINAAMAFTQCLDPGCSKVLTRFV
jgi:hypothetical protein